MKIAIVSQLSIGDAYIQRKILADPFLEAGHEVVVICNRNNRFVFGDLECIVEDWPLSKRRFYSPSQFRLLSSAQDLAPGTAVLASSGHFLERLYTWLRFRGSPILTAKIQRGLRSRMNDQIIGGVITRQCDIKLESLDAYGGHFEFFCKANERLGLPNPVQWQLDKLLGRVVRFQGQFAIIQTRGAVAAKSAPLRFVVALVRALRRAGAQIILLSDSFKARRVGRFCVAISPREFVGMSNVKGYLAFMLDTFLLHYSVSRADRTFVFIALKYGYDWVPGGAQPVSSIYSLVQHLKLIETLSRAD